MEYKEILARTAIYLQKITTIMKNNGKGKEDVEALKKALEVIEKIEVEE